MVSFEEQARLAIPSEVHMISGSMVRVRGKVFPGPPRAEARQMRIHLCSYRLCIDEA